MIRVWRRFFRVRRHLIWKSSCDIAEYHVSREGESYLILDASNLDEFSAVVEELRRLSSEAEDYISDVRDGKIVALVIMQGGEIVHYSYVFLKNRSACILGLSRDTALIGNAYTIPSYRRNGCQARSVVLRAAIARDRGFSFVAAETSLHNIASQRGLTKGGMTFVGRLDLAVVLSFVVIRWRRPLGSTMLGICLCL